MRNKVVCVPWFRKTPRLLPCSGTLYLQQRAALSSLQSPYAPSASPKSGSNYEFVTTPIFYVNARPHLGHAYSALLADARVRWRRIRNPEYASFLSTGTDEHGTKIRDAALKVTKCNNEAQTCQDFCDDISRNFRGAFDTIDVQYDTFIRTTSSEHKKVVRALWKRLENSGHIYLGTHEGWYCPADESFLTPKQVEKESDIMVSSESGRPVVWIQEPNYKFRLSAFQDKLSCWLRSNPDVIAPSFMHTET